MACTDTYEGVAPSLCDFTTWIGLSQPWVEDSDEQVQAEVAFAAALATINDRCRELAEDDEYPIGQFAAVLMLARRLLKRRGTPEGVADFGDSGVVLIQRLDPDIEALIRFHKRLTFG